KLYSKFIKFIKNKNIRNFPLIEVVVDDKQMNSWDKVTRLRYALCTILSVTQRERVLIDRGMVVGPPWPTKNRKTYQLVIVIAYVTTMRTCSN
ncbi:MAG: hypothetical protein Q8877_03230, partial [Sweet potato little leaf phytoplasma]|nr:hypothetical protein [Sweet potato little leaf phytoplasma]